jgi:peroxiredoxin Q/BCP
MKTLRNLLCLGFLFALSAAALARPDHPVAEGQIAPRFTGEDQDGHSWKLSQHLAKKMVFLYFYPADDTAGGATEACNLRDNMLELRQEGVDVVGVSFDNKQTHRNFVFKYNVNFPLLADTGGHIADAYGVRTAPDKKLDRRVSFLIGLDGKIMHVTDSPDAALHMKELATALAKLKEKAAL